ncbi:cytochrome c oxidase assembly protein subunit 15 [Amycolatopsis arida]|uniref:Cytochrome c oxidase assembly protein subunit 15 n=1 Tax=Amycolatopsis arida TaxID=587909 RepID=A0A1I5Z135_9PSEU|nr:COX15/CtaA family protein [Amycolatopsis arida]TDX90032.1 cytochrome c oxidase assembly protein subunit 15 [Amycolatopsis arida]SFQ50129.1 cytochrome c oxidase assembly protein subunit 15 [Amycolatopsis arida]
MQISRLIARLPYPSATLQRGAAIAAIIAQGGIGVTGSIVRVTGSGLACPTWPQCFEGSMFPVQHPEYAALNTWIEFGNRMLTGVVVLVAALCVVVAWRVWLDHPERKRLLALAWTMPAGVVAQAVIGGLTVLTGLLWWTVAIHFLASTVLVWLATVLLHAFGEGDTPPRWRVPPVGRGLLVALVVALAGTLVAGTTVTGAGPHGGDSDVPRLQAPIETLVQVHAAMLVTYLVVLAVFGLQLLRVGADRRLWRRYGVTWAVALAQGGLGSLQHALGVPEELVSLHVLGAMAVIVTTATLWCAARDRGPAVGHSPATEPALAITR